MSELYQGLVAKKNDLVLGSFTLTKTGITVEGEPTFREWSKVGEFIQRAHNSSALWLGDWINYGENHYGEKYLQAIEETAYGYGSLRNIAYVSRKVPIDKRKDGLSFSHHCEVANLEPDEQEELLTTCEENGWTRQELRAKVKEYKRSKGYISLNQVLTDNVSVKLLNADFGTDGGQIGAFQLALWEVNSELHNDFGQLVDLFNSCYSKLDEGGLFVLFVSPGATAQVVQAVNHIDSPVWICALHQESELVMERNIASVIKLALIFRKHPKRSFIHTIKDLSTQRTLIEELAAEATNVLVYRPEDTFIPHMITGKSIVLLEPSPKYYQLLKGTDEKETV